MTNAFCAAILGRIPRWGRPAGAILMILLAGMLPLAASAAEPLSIQLNKLEPDGEDCRAYIVLENAADRHYESLRLDLVLFDADGIVARRLAVQAAPLAAGKTSVKVFGIDGLDCGDIGRVLLNDVLECKAGGVGAADCLAAIEPSAAGSVAFFK